MEVTCERCNTEYEFDDALVSDQGTSVRCTQCGFKFRVKRESGNAPEVWVVRTVDGRELEFRALRELKGAISTGRIGRDDVLSRGVGRPRRLASIAELEPFFVISVGKHTSTAVGLGDTPRPRSRTPHGLGPPSATERTENSVAFSLPKLAAEATVREPPRSKQRHEGMTTSVLGTPSLASGATGPASTSFTTTGPESFEPETTPRRRSRPPHDKTAQGSSLDAAATAAGAAAMHQEDEVTHAKPRQASDRPKRAPSASLPGGHDVVGPPTPPPRAVVEEPPPSQREAAPPPPPAPAPTDEQPKARTAPNVAPIVEDRAPDPAPLPKVAPVVERADTESEPPASVRPNRSARQDADDDDARSPAPHKVTPTPAEMRFSITSEDTSSSDPRFTSHSSRGGSSAVRLFAGLVIFGLLGFGAVLLVRYLKSTPKTADASADQRIGALLTESDKLLHDGDVDGANDQLVKASALSDSDARVARAQARLANVRAEVPCLRADLLSDGDAERETAIAECADAAEKANKAVARALSIAPDDPEAVRAQIDQKRLSGDVGAARKLVDRISSIQSQPETALVLGALDLREASPPWQSVIDRLSKAAAEEGDLGRARALLVYALARSGDVKRARSEYEKIARMTHAHPLKATLVKFLDRADKGELPALRVDDLPSASGTAAPIGSGKLSDDTTLLSQAHSAFARHDLSRAEKLYQTVLDRDPQSGEAVAGLAAVAREEGQLGRADALYKRSLEQNNGYIPAIVSAADLKWETGQKDAAVDLYSRLLELDPNGPDSSRARSRIAERNADAASHPDSSSGAATATPTAVPSAPEPPMGSTSTGLPADVPLSP